MLRIPTKSLESLKRLFLVFLIEIVPKSQRSGFKLNKEAIDITKLEFKGDYFVILPLYSLQSESIITDDIHTRPMYQVDKSKFQKIRIDKYQENFKRMENSSLKLDIKVISSEFT